MILEQLPLARQLDIVFQEIKDELRHLASGIVFIQIRNNIIGKFGIKHDPLESRAGVVPDNALAMSEEHLQSFRTMALASLRHKQNWTHGEIHYEFAVRKGALHASIQLESNYNLASLFVKKN